jgi:hypothetical protein
MILGVASAQAQEQDYKRYNIQLGFYAGPVNYIGDYNAWLFGSPYPYGNEQETPQTWNSGDLDFGVWTKVMLKPWIYLRANAQFGSLAYQIEDINYKMQTPYSLFGLGVELQAFPEKTFRPYLGTGFDLLNFKAPPQNKNLDFSQNSQLVLGQKLQSYAIPISVGANIQLSDFTTLFLETTFHYTGSDQLDNFTPSADATNSLLNNDSFISYRAGIGVSIVDLIRLKFGNHKVQKAQRIEISSTRTMAKLTNPIIDPEPLVPADSLEATRRRLYPDQYASEEPEIKPDTTGGVIPVVDPKNRKFEPEAAVDDAEKMMEDLEERIAAGEVEDPQKARARIPRVRIKPDPIPVEMSDKGVVSNDPPEGYYVQVYASVGPISAQRARDMAIEDLKGIVQAPKHQVIITKRKQFYEVRIGVFDSYDDTIGVLEAVQGTFFDAYTLIFIPEERLNE